MMPTLEEAIRLKERIVGKAIWGDEPNFTAIKHVVQRMILHDLGKPVERVVLPAKPRDADKLEDDVKKKLGIQKRIEDPLVGQDK